MGSHFTGSPAIQWKTHKLMLIFHGMVQKYHLSWVHHYLLCKGKHTVMHYQLLDKLMHD